MDQEESQAVADMRESLKSLLSFDDDEMYGRQDWGAKTLNQFKPDFRQVFDLGQMLSALPYDLLPDPQLKSIQTPIDNTATHFGTIDEYDLSAADQSYDALVALAKQVKDHANALTVAMAPWVSYLAYRQGDVAENIAKIQSAIGEANNLVEDGKEYINEKKGEIKTLIQSAQDAAGEAGVAVFSKQFKAAARLNAREAKQWLTATKLAAAILLGAILISFFIPPEKITEWTIRAALIGVLATATLWCGTTYRILRHQETMNRHKANGLRSFLLFRDAADNDEATRNAVLMETTKSIFSAPSTGFIKENSEQQDKGIQIIDARSAGALGAVARGSKVDGPE